MNTFEFSGSTKTLRQRLNEGRIPVQEGLRYAALLTEALRAIHDEGRSHGSVTPESIALTSHGLDLLPAVPGIMRISPYTAPEVAGEQKPADARSDIFSFGAIVFEMLTGRKAFEGDSEAALRASLCGSPAPPSGSPAVDRLLAGCFAKDPAVRWQRMQKIQLELKLITAAARRVGAPALTRIPHSGSFAAVASVADTSMRVEMAQLEARLNAKLAAHEQAVADMQQAVSEAVSALRSQVSVLSLRVSSAQTQVSIAGDAAPAIEAAAHRIASQLHAEVQENIEHLSRRIAYVEQGGVGTAVAPEEIARVEAGLDGVRRQLSELHTNMAEDFHEFELNLKAQSSAIDSARTAMCQTDDLVERVVEALESLQTSLIEQSEDRLMAIG
jgi:hypothetical protein